MKVKIKNTPKYDPHFMPIGTYKREYEKQAHIPLCIAAQRKEAVSVIELKLRGTSNEDLHYAERMAKTLLWQKGGSKLIVCGPKKVYEYIKDAYRAGGQREFDIIMMERVYETEFTVEYMDYGDRPRENEQVKNIGRNLDGCRIGFDAGGSDRKVSAVIDGESVFSQEMVWFPKTNSDPQYHYDGILSALKSAAEHMPRVDAIGVSSAGIFVENRTAVASLFRAVGKVDFEKSIRDIYLNAAKEIGNVPIQVCNDGDVTALAGSMYFDKNALLGIAMGTSEAAGYVDNDGNITGWINELAFVPVDMNPYAIEDEWSHDFGCGVSYFSQDGVIKLAEYAGFNLPNTSPAQKLKIVQQAATMQDVTALQIFSDIGCYLGHTLAFYYDIYDVRNVLLLGRVMSGAGGEIIYMTARRVLAEEYEDVKLDIVLPDDKFRRVGQSMAAASLPIIEKQR